MSEKMRHLYIASNVTVGVSFVLSLLLHFLGYSTLALCAAAYAQRRWWWALCRWFCGLSKSKKEEPKSSGALPELFMVLEIYAQRKFSSPAPTSKWYLAMPRSILL